jgi:RNA polymerase sigma-70 factor (ECF subfamily)
VTSPLSEPLDDPALLLRIATQDRAAFRVFYDRHAPRVLAVVRHMVPHPETAEDLLQDVFLLVWRKAGSYRPERGDVGGWLFTICRNRVADHFRSAPKTRRLETDEVRTLPAEKPAVEDEMRMTLAEVLANLAPDQREAVDLAYFGGLTYEETAQQLAIPLGTLKSRVRAALARLRGALESA